MSYCGLTAALKSSAGKQQRGPISKQRNHWLQSTLIEAAKLAPRWNPQLAALHAANWNADIATVHAGGGPQTRHLSAGRGQKRQSFQLRALGPDDKRRRKGHKKSKPLRRKNFKPPAIDRPFLANSGTGQRSSHPDAPYRLYRGRPANPNSYFVTDSASVPANGCLARLPPWPLATIAGCGCTSPCPYPSRPDSSKRKETSVSS